LPNKSDQNGSLASPAMPHLEALPRSDVAALMPALKNSEVDFDTEELLQESDLMIRQKDRLSISIKFKGFEHCPYQENSPSTECTNWAAGNEIR